jgi:cytochrome d ubiquinol oxidase subunit I
MVGAGSALALVALWWVGVWWRRRSSGRSMPYPNEDRTLLWAVALSGPLGFLALEAGWTVTEVGRQPWIVYGLIRTGAAVTPVAGLGVPFALVGVVYLGLGIVVAVLLGRLFLKTGAAHVG